MNTMTVYRVSEEIAELIKRANLSPPICVGRVSHGVHGDRFFIGLTTPDAMHRVLAAKTIDWSKP